MANINALHLRHKEEIESSIQSIIDKAAFIKGDEVALFEQDLESYLNVPHAISCGSGTDALTIAMMALGLERGDEVIMPSFAYAALPEAALLLGIKPVFVDINENYLLDVDALETAITEKTKAIAAVHLFGAHCDMDSIKEIADRHDLRVIEDAAQSLGTYYQGIIQGYTGCIGDIGITSFFPSKNLGCYGDGGAIFTKSKELADKARMIANHGQNKRYYHEIIGLNSRLDTIQAAVLRVKLKYLNGTLKRRISVAHFYHENLSEISQFRLPRYDKSANCTFHQYTIECESGELRDKLQDFLKSKDISVMVYYPLPLHQQKAYSQSIPLKNAERMSKRVLSLPICSEKTTEELEYITNQIKDFFNPIK